MQDVSLAVTEREIRGPSRPHLPTSFPTLARCTTTTTHDKGPNEKREEAGSKAPEIVHICVLSRTNTPLLHAKSCGHVSTYPSLLKGDRKAVDAPTHTPSMQDAKKDLGFKRAVYGP